jgi:hypothetical protein
MTSKQAKEEKDRMLQAISKQAMKGEVCFIVSTRPASRRDGNFRPASSRCSRPCARASCLPTSRAATSERALSPPSA